MNLFNKIKKEKNFIFILFLGLTLRFIQFLLYKEDFLDWDELMAISWNMKYVSIKDLLTFIIDSDPHPPLFNIIARPFVLFFNDPYNSLKLLSVFFSTSNIVLVYFVIKEFTSNKKNALWAMLFIAVNPFQVYQSIRVIPYISFLTLVLLSNLFYLKILKKNNLFYSSLYIVFSILMFYTHFFASFAIISQILFILFKYKGAILKQYLKNYLIMLLCCLPYLFIAKTSPLNPSFYNSAVKGHIAWISKTEYLSFFLRLFNYFNGFFHAKLFNVQGLEIFFFLSLFIAIFIEFFYRRKNGKLYFVFLIPSFLILITSFIYQIIFDAGFLELRHFIILFPFYILLLSFLSKNIKVFLVIIFSILCITNFFEYSRSELFQAKRFIFDKSEKINIYIHPRHYRININHYFKDYSEKFIFFEDKEGLPEIKSSLDTDFYIFIKSMGEDSVESMDLSETNYFIETKYSGHIKSKFNIGENTVVYRISSYLVNNTESMYIPVIINGEYNVITKPFHIINTLISLFFSYIVFYNIFKKRKKHIN